MSLSLAELLILSCGGEVPRDIANISSQHSALSVGPAPARGAEPLPGGADLTAPLSALFIPDDPTLTLEFNLIAAVVSARQADSKDYDAATNPYRIRYSVENLSHLPIVERLAEARDKGVFVQIQIDSSCIELADLSPTAAYLISKGFAVAPDNRVLLDDATRLKMNLIGIKMSFGLYGLMHTKMRLYETPAQKWLLTGSQNPSAEAQKNEETLHLIRDARIYAQYAAAYDAIQRGKRIPNHWTAGAAVNVLFGPADNSPYPGRQLLDWLETENEQILLSVFCLRDFTAPGAGRGLVALLRAKVAAGVSVWVLTDRKQADGIDRDGKPVDHDDPTEDTLRTAGVHVYEILNTAGTYTSLHTKAAILGRTHLRIITDTANYSRSALGSATDPPYNYESVLFIDSTALDAGLTGRRYLAQWMKILSRWADQSAASGEPSFADAYQQLSKGAGWPRQTMTFTATNAYTTFGEEVQVLGSVAALGDWGISSTGLFLTTGAGTYPTWQSSSAVTLPVGTWFEWKLAVSWGMSTAHRWESGDNRADLVQLGPLTQHDVLDAVVQWR